MVAAIALQCRPQLLCGTHPAIDGWQARAATQPPLQRHVAILALAGHNLQPASAERRHGLHLHARDRQRRCAGVRARHSTVHTGCIHAHARECCLPPATSMHPCRRRLAPHATHLLRRTEDAAAQRLPGAGRCCCPDGCTAHQLRAAAAAAAAAATAAAPQLRLQQPVHAAVMDDTGYRHLRAELEPAPKVLWRLLLLLLLLCCCCVVGGGVCAIQGEELIPIHFN